LGKAKGPLFSLLSTLLVCIFRRVLERLRGKECGFEVRPPGGSSAWQFYFFYLNICLLSCTNRPTIHPPPKKKPTPPRLRLCFSELFPAFLAIAELSEQWKLKIWPSLAQGDLHVNLWSAAWEFPACTYTATHTVHHPI